MVGYIVGHTEALKFIRRDAKYALATHEVGAMTACLKQILWHANNALDLYELYFPMTKSPENIARWIADKIAEELKCHVEVQSRCDCDERSQRLPHTGDNGNKDIGYELVTRKGNFYIAVVLEDTVRRVYNECPERHPVPLKNVGELLSLPNGTVAD